MSYLYPNRREWWHYVVVVEATIVVAWGGGILFLSNYASGPFTPVEWAQMALLWIAAPLVVTGALVAAGRRELERGSDTLGSLLVIAPLILLTAAAVWTVGLL